LKRVLDPLKQNHLGTRNRNVENKKKTNKENQKQKKQQTNKRKGQLHSEGGVLQPNRTGVVTHLVLVVVF